MKQQQTASQGLTRQELGRLIKEKRLEMGMTLNAFAAFLGVGKSTLTFWERGRCFPSPKMQARIAELLQRPHSELFPGPKNTLAAMCKQRGISMRELAAKIGASDVYVYEIARGEYGTPLTVATKIAKVLDCRVEDLGLKISRRSTRKADWKNEALTPELKAQRDELFKKYEVLIPLTCKRYAANIRASHTSYEDAMQVMRYSLLRSTTSLILRKDEPETATNYMLVALKHALFQELAANKHRGITNAPNDVIVMSIDAMIDAGLQI